MPLELVDGMEVLVVDGGDNEISCGVADEIEVDGGFAAGLPAFGSDNPWLLNVGSAPDFVHLLQIGVEFVFCRPPKVLFKMIQVREFGARKQSGGKQLIARSGGHAIGVLPGRVVKLEVGALLREAAIEIRVAAVISFAWLH